MSDVARELEVSVGTIYQAVESKEALFDLVVRHGLQLNTEALPEMPIATPPPGATLDFLSDLLVGLGTWPELDAAIANDAPADVIAEFEEIIDQAFERMHRYRFALQVMSRSALEWPALAEILFTGLRSRFLMAMTQYFEVRIASGHLETGVDSWLRASFMLESLATWSFHRYGDPIYKEIDVNKIRSLLTSSLVQGVGFRGPVRRNDA